MSLSDMSDKKREKWIEEMESYKNIKYNSPDTKCG